MSIIKQQSHFSFIGNIKSVEYVEPKEKGKNGYYNVIIEDKATPAEGTLRIFEGDEAKTYNRDLKQTNSVTGTKEEIAKKMAELKANGVNILSEYKIVGKTTSYVYTNNAFIEQLKKVPKTTKIALEGNLSYKIYNNRTQRELNVKTLRIATKDEITGLYITTPVVFSPSQFTNIKFEDLKYGKSITGLVKAKLDNNAGYGYRPMQINLTAKQFLNGMIFNPKATMTDGQRLNLLNTCITTVIGSADKTRYNAMVIQGKLKTGNISRKATLDDINPMELIILQAQGEEMVKSKLDSLGIIDEYSDITYLNMVVLNSGAPATEAVNESELNLLGNATADVGSTPSMMDILNNTMGLGAQTPSVESPEVAVETHKLESPDEEVAPEPVKSKTDELANLVAEAEAEVTTTVEETKDDSEDFPFN